MPEPQVVVGGEVQEAAAFEEDPSRLSRLHVQECPPQARGALVREALIEKLAAQYGVDPALIAATFRWSRRSRTSPHDDYLCRL